MFTSNGTDNQIGYRDGLNSHVRIQRPGLPVEEKPHDAMLIRVNYVELSRKKANGKSWDACGDPPDPFVEVYVNGRLAKTSAVVKNQYSIAPHLEIECFRGDRIRVTVIDKDIKFNDWAGEVLFTAEANELITSATDGQISTCNISVGRKPLVFPDPTKEDPN